MSDDENPLPSVVDAYRIITGQSAIAIGKKVGRDLVVPCVSKANHRHGDEKPSLRIDTAADIWRCDPCAAQGVPGGKSTHLAVHAGVCRDLSDASKYLAPREEKKTPPPQEFQTLVASYDYCAANGPILYQVRRFEWKNDDGTVGKTFSQRRLLDDGKWDSRLGDVDRVPYRFPQMIYECIDQGKTLYVVEGEKDVLRLEALGLVATTNAGGAGWTWTPQFVECFRGVTRVVVIGDNDEPGRAAARAHASALSLACGAVYLVESIPGIKHKGDCSDWLDENGSDDLARTAKKFRAMLNGAAKMVGVEVDDGSVTPMTLSVLHQRILAMQNAVVPSTPFGIKMFDAQLGGMQQGRVTVIAARTNQGKTALAARIAALASQQVGVLVFSFEMGQLQWHDRLAAQHQGKTVVAYRSDGRPELEGERLWFDSHNMLIAGGGRDATLERIESLVSIHQPAVVVIDHLRHIRGWMGNGKVRADLAASEIMYAFPEIARRLKTHFLLLHQLNRQAADEPSLADLRDAGAVEEAADNVILIDRPFKTVRGERAADGSQADDVMHAHLAKSREGAEIFAHLAWQGPIMLPRSIGDDEAHFRRCCADPGYQTGQKKARTGF